MSPFLVCSPSLIISGLAPMESGLDILRGGSGGVGDRKAFHQAGKLKKHFGYQALADLAPTPSVCACLIFQFFPLFPLLFFLLPHSWWNRVRFDQRLHLPSDVC